MTSAIIRNTFLEFFKSKQHTIVPSAPIVIKNDPTLLFTNAGMNQFKDYFLGNQIPPYSRVADTQKCLRVSGKHNDLEEVGVDTYHHTMFEMLGNWSFGDYFKKEAIAWSWELLTEVFKIDKDKLYVSVFAGDEKEGLPFDEEAYQEWKKWIAEDRILKGNKKDNFWEMGETGPCGPCSEIHVDCRPENERAKESGALLVNADHPQVIEIWNNVFMQFNRLKNGSLENLPARHVDTGMGFERLVRVLQQKDSNYDTDIFTTTISYIEEITKQIYDFGNSKKAVAFRVLSDHIRAIAFAISDGQLPSNTGAGYVIRRILRRAVRYYFSYLDYKTPLLYQLIPVIAKQFETVFPELSLQSEFVIKVIREEEESFLRTLEKGLKRIEDIIGNASSEKTIGGKQAFELYDTFGFPIDLTRLIALENQMTVDETGFEAEMQAQKNRSRKATAIDASDWIWVNQTSENEFVGYDQLNTQTEITKYRKVKAKNKELYQIVLAKTGFYAESGGQVGDTGLLIRGQEKLQVFDTKKENGEILHFTEKIFQDMQGSVKAEVDADRRLQIMNNHTATHLLHAALKQVIGKHVNQKGSLVSPELLRFDVSHFMKITDEQIQEVVQIVNDKIRANIPVITKQLPKQEALALGAMALFGEKYGDQVRVVIIDPDFSIELCGGTHITSTGNIGLFTIQSESAVAAGVRRIEAITGRQALLNLLQQKQTQKSIEELLKTKDPVKTIEKLLEEKTDLEKRIENLENKEILNIKDHLLQQIENIQDIQFIGSQLLVPNADTLKKICFQLRSHLNNYIIVLTANIEGKASVVLLIDEKIVLEKGLDASKIMKEKISTLIKGGGGGQKSLATAGGQDASNLDKIPGIVKSVIL